MAKRPPIIVVMGHVDHGKTTLLDYIRIHCAKAAPTGGEPRSIAEREAGGITQSIGAYEIEHNKQKLTFIDTPGHEAFMAMRERGANAADLGILVVAADDSVQNQTKEAFKILEHTKTPFVVAINKVDKNNADVNRAKNDLAQAGILLEGYGGNVSWHAVSAKTGEGVNELLDLLVLASELEPLTYDPSAPAQGFILESHLDPRRGVVASAIIKNGTLRVGDPLSSPSASGKLKLLENFLGKRVKEAQPSAPVLILGFTALPRVGEEFSAITAATSTASPTIDTQAPRAAAEAKNDDRPTVYLILKGDTSGSLEVLSSIVRALPIDKANLVVIGESVGEITDGDVQGAIAHQALIIGFRSQTTKQAATLAKNNRVRILTSEIVYELIKAVEDELKGASKKVVNGDLEILAVFGKKDGKQIIGGKVVVGEIKNNATLEVERRGEVTCTGRIVNLQQQRADAKVVTVGNECGLLFEAPEDVRMGDHLVSRQ